MSKHERIVMIGAGNVGSHLSKRFFEMGNPPVQVFSRKISKAKQLAKVVGAAPCNQLSDLFKDATIYILAIHDGAIGAVAEQLAIHLPEDALVVHTSGATPITVIKKHFKNYGSFYPLQTFSLQRAADFSTIPLLYDAPRKALRNRLQTLAKLICPNTYYITDKERATLHVAAVFVNNFTNQLFHIGDTILEDHHLSLDILRPLIKETIAKVANNRPYDMQTGPAKRGDEKTIQQHMDFLKKYPEYASIYALLSKDIRKTHS